MSFLYLNGLRYHIEEQGDGPPLVLLHGFTGRAASWQSVAAQLAKHRRVIAVDLPGHGETDLPANVERFRMESVAADLVTLLGELDEPMADWLGYSMGGRLALYIAIQQPQLVRSLILESASPGLETATERRTRCEQDNALAARIERDGVAAFVAEWERLPLLAGQARLPDTSQARLRKQRLANSAAGLAGSLRGMGTGTQPSLWPRLGEIAVPALFIVGEEDEKFVEINRRMAAAVPDSRLCVVPTAGHTVHLEQPEAWQTAVDSFLNEEQQ